MKHLFYNLFLVFNKSFIITACLIINFLLVETYAQEKRLEYKNDRQSFNGKRGVADNSKTLEDFFKEDGSFELDTTKLNEYLNSNESSLLELINNHSNAKGITTSPIESINGNGFLMSEDLNKRWWSNTWNIFQRWSYTYDANNNQIEELQQGWNNVEWYNSTRWISTYDINNNQLENLIQLYNYGGVSGWGNYFRYLYTYDVFNNCITMIRQFWNVSYWRNSTKDSLVYDANNNMIEDIYHYWNGSAWVPNTYTYYTYDENNNLIEKRIFLNYQKWLYTYDVNNNLLEELFQQYSNSIWENREKRSWTYDVNNNCLTYLFQTWVVSNWANTYRTDYTYDTNNNLISEVGKNWTIPQSDTSRMFSSVSFTEDYRGWVVGDNGIIFGTTNGGANWTRQTTETTNTNNLYGVTCISASPEDIGWIVGASGTILHETHAGRWPWVSQTSGTTEDLVDVTFINANNGWVVGFDGTILKTTNGGTTWTQQTSGVSNVLLGVYFVDVNTGWAVGTGGIIIKTTNGGSTWTQQTYGGSDNLQDIYFIDVNTGWAVGNYGTILKTTNGGQNWNFQTSGTTSHLIDVSFTDVNNGKVVGFYGTILKTTNGGVTWTSQTSGTTNDLGFVYFTDVNTGWAVGENSTILKTINGGQSWVIVLFSWLNDYKYSYEYDQNNNLVSMINEDGNGSGWINYSRDIYSYVPAQGERCEINGIVTDNLSTPLEDATVTLTGQYNTSKTDTTDVSGNFDFNDVLSGNYNISASFPGYYTSSQSLFIEGGDTGWVSQTSGTTEHLIWSSFIDANTGWVVGNGGTILKTTNGGANWIEQTSGTVNGLASVKFIDANLGWVVGHSGTIKRTTDGGITWTQQSSGTSELLYAVDFIDVNNGWVVGTAGKIFRTTNGGTNWTSQLSGTTETLANVLFFDDGTGTIVGNAGKILRTTNGGADWTPQSSGTLQHLRGITFISKDIGTVTGFNGVILKTTNGGTTWTSQTSGTTEILHGACFTDLNNGTVVGYNGVILKTTNGGMNWTLQEDVTTESLRHITVVDGNAVWIVGLNGTILHTNVSSSTYTVNFTLSPVTAGFIPITDSLRIYADTITNISTNKFLASGNVNINGILYFDSTMVTVDKSGSTPIVEGNGKLTAKDIQGTDYEIADGNFKYKGDVKKLIPAGRDYVLEGFYKLLGIKTLVGALTIDPDGDFVKHDILLFNPPFPINFIYETLFTASGSLPYPTNITGERTYYRTTGESTSFDVTLTSMEEILNLGGFAIAYFHLAWNTNPPTFEGGLTIQIPGKGKTDSTKNKNLNETLEDFNKINVNVLNNSNENLYSTNFENLLGPTQSSKSKLVDLNFGFKIVDGRLDSVSIKYTGDILIDGTGIKISNIGGGMRENWKKYFAIADLKTALPDIPTIGPIISLENMRIEIAPWTNLSGSFGDVKLFGQVIHSFKRKDIFHSSKSNYIDGYLTYDNNLHAIKLGSSVDLFDIIKGNFDASLRGDNFAGSIQATIKTPANLPSWLNWAENKTLASAEVNVHNTTMKSKVQLKVGRIWVPFKWKNVYLNLAMKINVDDNFPYLHTYFGTNYDNLYQLSKEVKKGELADTTTITFSVHPNTKQLFVIAGNNNNLFDFYLESPTGEIFDSTNTCYTKYVSTMQTAMVVDKPDSSDSINKWKFITTEPNPDSVSFMEINQQPIVLVNNPSQKGTRSNIISLKFNDYNDTLHVQVYYDTDNKNYDGVFIQEFTVLNNDSLEFTWLNDEVPNGEYFIYCRIDDGQNAPALQYAPGSISVHNSTFAETPQNFTVVQEGDSTIKASWTGSSDSSITIIFYKNVTTGKIAQEVIGDTNNVYIKNLKYGQEYKFWAAFVDPDNNNPGPKSDDVNLIFAHSTQNDPPCFTLNPDSFWVFIEGELKNYNLTAVDAENDPVIFGVSQNPPGMTVSGNELIWTPTYDDRGAFNILLTASDVRGGIDSLFKEVIVYIKEQMDTVLDFSSLNLYNQDNKFIVLTNYKSPNNSETVTLINAKTKARAIVACRRVDDFQFIGDVEAPNNALSMIGARDGDTVIAVYGNLTNFAVNSDSIQHSDNIPPGPITDLDIIGLGANQITLKWTAPGDDGNIGNALIYDLRYSYSPILADSDYVLAKKYEYNLYPSPGGHPDSLILNLKNLTGSASHDTVYFSIKAEDDGQNISSLGNCAQYNYLIIPDSVFASVFNVYKMNIDWSEISEKDWRIEEKGDVAIGNNRSIINSDDNVTVPIAVIKKDRGIVPEGGITINHYKVFRKIDNNTYVTIADSITASTFTDNLFSTPDGVYKYGIKAVYSSGEESEMATSNSVTMNRFTNLRILCTIQDTTSYSDINLFMEGLDTVYHQIYSRTTNSTGLILIDNVYQTQYRLELSKPGYMPIIDTISVSDATYEFSYQLVRVLSCKISVIVEGLYNVSTNTLNMMDYYKVYLRYTSPPYTIVDSAVCAIDPADSLSQFTGHFNFPNAPNGTYFLVVKHRNSIETWSKAGGVTLAKGIESNYNFTTSSSQAYGNNIVLKGSKWCIYSGDINQDGIIDAQDLAAADNNMYNYVTGYVPTDVDGDGLVNSDDMDIIYNNSCNFISTKKPSDVIIMKAKEQKQKTGSQ